MGTNYTDEMYYADLADELNDYDVELTVDDFDRSMVAAAARYAAANGLSFPPARGDFDRFCERRRNG